LLSTARVVWRFGPHSLRRANITWRQEVGGSSIKASKIAGHANTKITEEYTIVQLKRQDELSAGFSAGARRLGNAARKGYRSWGRQMQPEIQ
jgi:integrase